DYLLLEDTRLGDRCRIEFELSREPARYLIYPMLLLPFVENAFKHGANASRKASWIRVAVEVNNGELQFVVENSRVPSPKKPTMGTGLNNVRRRLNILYPNAHELMIDDANPTQYQAKLKLQLHAAG
ncbi:MAG: sensor histidine kinase, partial [Bacteroidota bacterium]